MRDGHYYIKRALILVVLFVLSFFFMLYVWYAEGKSLRSESLSLAVAAEAGFSEDTVSSLEGKADETGTAAYRSIKQSLSEIAGTNEDARFVYIYTLREGKVRFIADSEPHGSDDQFPVGQEFTEADPAYRKAFEDGVPTVAGPVKDRRGTWMSALVPMADNTSGEVIAVFAVDYPAGKWNRTVLFRTMRVGAVVLFINFFLLFFFESLQKNVIFKRERKKTVELTQAIKKARDRMTEAQSLLHMGNWEFGFENKKFWMSDETLKILGIKPDGQSVSLDELLRLISADEGLKNIRERFNSLLDKEQKLEFEQKIFLNDDSDEKVLRLVAELERDEDGEPVRIVGIVQDMTARRRVEEKMRDNDRYLRTLFEQSPIGISLGNSSGEIIDVNPMFRSIVGRTSEELIGIRWQDITHPDDIEEDAKQFGRFLFGEVKEYKMIKRYIRPDGSIVWVNMKIAPIMFEGRPDLTHICIVEDISERVKTERELRERERSNAVLLSNIPGMAYRCNFDRNWTMQFVSEGCFELTGYKPENLIGNKELTFSDIIMPAYRDYLWDKWNDVLKQKAVFREEYLITTKTGEEKWVFEQGRGVYGKNGEVLAIESLVIDVSKQKEREEEVRYLIYHDVMTGLYNRSYFEEQRSLLDEEEQLPLSVITGDINGLKMVNETVGHAEGDKIINNVAKIIGGCLREGDLLARTGGDEFSILLPNTGSDEANRIMKQIAASCEEYRKEFEDVTYQAYISLGCATKFKPSDSIDSVLKSAEENMYRDKLLQKSSMHSSVLSSLTTTLYERSHETEEHAQRIVELTKAMGQKLDLVDEQLNELEILSTLHDIGKIGISDNILNKPGKLSDDEWVEMRKHPEIGYRIAMSTQELIPIAYYILCHHERWDGTGYPRRLKGEEIPLLSRILSVADAYDAMTEDRPYRKALSRETALGEIERNSGTQFDPEIVGIFLGLANRGR